VFGARQVVETAVRMDADIERSGKGSQRVLETCLVPNACCAT